MNHLLLGDIVLERGDNLLSNGILECQRHRGEGRSVVSHVGLIVEGGNPLKARLIESLHTTVVRPLSVYMDGKHSFVVFRNHSLDGADRVKIANKAMSYKGRRYGYLKIVAHAADYALGGKYVFRRLCRMDKYPICSWLVSHAYDVIEYRFLNNLHPNLVQPDDIWDHIMKNLGEWEQV